jgi:hypothetical protein
MAQVIYIEPDCELMRDEIEAMPKDELLHFAKNCNEAQVYSLEGFQEAFNDELISDLGFIYIVE